MDVASLKAYRKKLDDSKDMYFAAWPINAKQRDACWKNLADTLDALIADAAKKKYLDPTDILKRCVERFNELDEGFIGTIEREDLCDILYEIGELCGMHSDEEWVDEWRDW